MELLKELYTTHTGKQPASVTALAGAGSNRQYYRFTADDGSTMIGVIGTSREENHAFVTIAKHFTERQLPVPQVHAINDDETRYLQQDLGSRSLFDAISHGRNNGGAYCEQEKELLVKTIKALPEVQVKGAEGFDWSVCYPQPAFDATNVMFDLNYFKYCFLKATGVDFHEIKLESDFEALAKDLTEGCENESVFMYRDCQARNVMLSDEDQPYFIDFQGGRRGPYYYDLASFAWQASAKYSNELRETLISEYYDALKSLKKDVPAKEQFLKRLNLFVFFRTLQVLGAYGFRGYFERKKHFIDSIPPALKNLDNILSTNDLPYTHLTKVLRRLIDQMQEEPENTPKQFDNSKLTVRVMSFSYKKGLPEDPSGNGGGYYFDCRSTHNPGRYEPYKKLTGLDKPVIQFLEENGEILTFLESVDKLVDAHVERYIERGFSSLMVCFGCTGGQHRSVYSAQHVAERIHKKYGVRVLLTHREQCIETEFPTVC